MILMLALQMKSFGDQITGSKSYQQYTQTAQWHQDGRDHG